MQLAYIIIAHKNFDQVQRPDEPSFRSELLFCSYCRSKGAPSGNRAFKAAMAKRANVRIIQTLTIEWGRFSLTKANIIGLKALFSHDIPFDYVFSMSGQDYPLVSSEGIKRVLREAGGFSFLEHHPFRFLIGSTGALAEFTVGIYSWPGEA